MSGVSRLIQSKLVAQGKTGKVSSDLSMDYNKEAQSTKTVSFGVNKMVGKQVNNMKK